MYNLKTVIVFIPETHMKSHTLALMATILAALSLSTGCKEKSSAKTTRIVTTIFPAYDWTRELTSGIPVELTMLMDNGTDMNRYQPRVQDIAKISACDIFIYVGGESDNWVNGVLRNVRNKNLLTVNLLQETGIHAKTEELKEGMENTEEAEETEYDEHVWLSLRNAKILCTAISRAAAQAAPAYQEVLEQNLETYTQKLNALDNSYHAVIQKAKSRTLVFGDRFPFRYLADDYSIDYYAAFPGCSAETEASFKTIKFLADKCDALDLNSIMVIEKSDKKIARTIIANSKNPKRAILQLDSMQAISSKDSQGGISYLTIMQKNLNALNAALR